MKECKKIASDAKGELVKMEKEKNKVFEERRNALVDKAAKMNELEAVKEQINTLQASSKKQIEEITLLNEEIEIKNGKIIELKKVKKTLVEKCTELKTLYKDQWEEKINEYEREIMMKNNVSEDYKDEIYKLKVNIEKLEATEHMYNTYKGSHTARKNEQMQMYDKVQLDIMNYNLAQKSKDNGESDIPNKYENAKKFLD